MSTLDQFPRGFRPFWPVRPVRPVRHQLTTGSQRGHDSGGVLGTHTASGDPAGLVLCVATRKQVLGEKGLLRRWAASLSGFLPRILLRGENKICVYWQLTNMKTNVD